jgi:chloramphenicol-sensitive protein RarD
MSGTLFAANWLLYVWAMLTGHILEGALGSYLNPFLDMLFGALWFGESHNRHQHATIALALCGAGPANPRDGHFPMGRRDSNHDVFALRRASKSVLLAPLALGWLVFHSSSAAQAFGETSAHTVLVIISGIATTLPLIFC